VCCCPILRGPTDIVIEVKTCTEPRINPSIITGVATTDHRKCQPVRGPGPRHSTVEFTSGVTSRMVESATVIDAAITHCGRQGGPHLTLPLLPNAHTGRNAALETAASSNCSAGTDCSTYTMLLPAGGPTSALTLSSCVTLRIRSSLSTSHPGDVAFVPSSGLWRPTAPGLRATSPLSLHALFPSVAESFILIQGWGGPQESLHAVPIALQGTNRGGYWKIRSFSSPRRWRAATSALSNQRVPRKTWIGMAF